MCPLLRVEVRESRISAGERMEEASHLLRICRLSRAKRSGDHRSLERRSSVPAVRQLWTKNGTRPPIFKNAGGAGSGMRTRLSQPAENPRHLDGAGWGGYSFHPSGTVGPQSSRMILLRPWGIPAGSRQARFGAGKSGGLISGRGGSVSASPPIRTCPESALAG